MSLTSSQTLAASTSSLSPSRQGSSHISKVYKQASQLFLTRRLADALSLLEPVLSTSPQTNGHKEVDEDSQPRAPIALATTSQRIKIWSLYVTLLNSIVDLTDDEGKQDFGQKKFKAIQNEVRKGDVWETIVQDGYAGREGSVDAEVVFNLTTLLLGQASDQVLTQQRLETYLSSSPDLDISSHLQRSPSRKSRSGGTNTPKDLSSRLKILELFTLHVLPRNEEWEYARSFISNSDILDEERREAFLQTLDELKDVQEPDGLPDEDMIQEQGDILKREHDDAAYRNAAIASRQASDASIEPFQGHKRTSSEVDYGIDSPRQKSMTNGICGAVSPLPSGVTSPPKKVLTPKAGPPPASSSKGRTGFPSSRPVTSPRSKNLKKAEQSDLFRQAKKLYRVLQNLVTNMAGNLTANSAAILKTLLFVIALLTMLGRGDIRERLRKVIGGSWDKVKGTVGMGVKVSYI